MQSLTPSPSGHLSGRDLRLDQLRGLAIIAVILLHLTPVTFATASPEPVWRALALVSVMAYQICQLAVPVFLLISLTLYLQRAHSGRGYLKRRLGRLTMVLGVWMLVYASLGVIVSIQEPIVRASQALAFPFTNGALYFLANLALATVLTAALARAETTRASVRYLLVAGLAASVVLLALAEATTWDPQFWSPVGFLPYPFAALLLRDGVIGKRTALVGFSAAVAFEAYLFVFGGLELAGTSVLGYARPTVLFGALLAYTLWMETREKRRPLLEWLGLNTLGVYLIHPLIIGALHMLGAPPLLLRGDWGVLSFSLSLTVATLVATFSLQVLLSKSFARSLVV